jgi:hypothetical protein
VSAGGPSVVGSTAGGGSVVPEVGVTSPVGPLEVDVGAGGGVQRRVGLCAGGVHGAGVHDEVGTGVHPGPVVDSAGGGVHGLVVLDDEAGGLDADVVEEVFRDGLVVEEVCVGVLEVQAGEGVMPTSGSFSPIPRATSEVAVAKPAASTSAAASARRIRAPSGCER